MPGGRVADAAQDAQADRISEADAPPVIFRQVPPFPVPTTTQASSTWIGIKSLKGVEWHDTVDDAEQNEQNAPPDRARAARAERTPQIAMVSGRGLA